ncbi:hypothetical protein BJ166DRAFT_631004 [Pestalotiopsis sp. NC0098]|nr:hypothetical protein BJ166DRAFT_631004 [Pestalotiopsis sp. NC0098]
MVLSAYPCHVRPDTMSSSHAVLGITVMGNAWSALSACRTRKSDHIKGEKFTISANELAQLRRRVAASRNGRSGTAPFSSKTPNKDG